MTVRRLNGIRPFPLEDIQTHALPELASNLLGNPEQRAIWRQSVGDV